MKHYLSCLLIMACLMACDFDSIELEKVKNPSLSPVVALNLGSLSYTVGDLVEDLEDESLQVETGSDMSLSLVINDTSVFDDIQEFVVLDQSITNTSSFTPFGVSIPAQPSVNVVSVPTQTFNFEFNSEGGEELDSVFFSAGNLRYSLFSSFGTQIDYRLTLSDVRNVSSNEPIVFENTILATQTSKSESISLADKKNIVERVGTTNIFNASLDLTFTIPSGVPINALSEMTLDLIFEDIALSAVFGDFGTDPITIQESTISTSAFDEFSDSGLFLADPSISLNFINSFGVEFGVSLANIVATNQDGSFIPLTGSAVTDLQFVDAPNTTAAGSAVSSVLSLNTANSNIADLLNSTPTSLTFSVDAIPNPTGSDNINNFLLDSSFVEIQSTVEVPLDLRMDGFSRSFDFSVDGGELDDADSIILELETTNDIPFNGSLDITFKDDAGTVLYTIPDLGLIESPASFNAEGRTTQPTTALSEIKLTEDAIEAFLNTTEITTTVNIFTFDTQSGTSVKIFSDYSLSVELKALAKISVQL